MSRSRWSYWARVKHRRVQRRICRKYLSLIACLQRSQADQFLEQITASCKASAGLTSVFFLVVLSLVESKVILSSSTSNNCNISRVNCGKWRGRASSRRHYIEIQVTLLTITTIYNLDLVSRIVPNRY